MCAVWTSRSSFQFVCISFVSRDLPFKKRSVNSDLFWSKLLLTLYYSDPGWWWESIRLSKNTEAIGPIASAPLRVICAPGIVE